jgi:hypothetical protein
MVGEMKDANNSKVFHTLSRIAAILAWTSVFLLLADITIERVGDGRWTWLYAVCVWLVVTAIPILNPVLRISCISVTKESK